MNQVCVYDYYQFSVRLPISNKCMAFAYFMWAYSLFLSLHSSRVGNPIINEWTGIAVLYFAMEKVVLLFLYLKCLGLAGLRFISLWTSIAFQWNVNIVS